MLVSILMWIVFSITICYLIVIGIITYGWYSLSNITLEDVSKKNVEVSVVIAVRNESANIQNLLNQLIAQQYNNAHFDIIIVDDHSTDTTLELIDRTISENTDITINVVNAIGSGKKNALNEGIKNSTAELIVTTDGDCEVLPGWLESIVDYYTTKNCKLIIGPVVYNNEKTILQKFFSLDFASLVASGAGSTGVGLPLMGNGANLSFTREVYNSTANHGNNLKYASGDDVFLIHNITKKYGSGSIGFLRNKNAIVSTLPPNNLSNFIKQRSRWASKTTGYELIWPITVALIVFLFNLVLSLILLASIYFIWLLPVYLLIIVTKFLIDSPLVFSFLSFAKKTNLKPLFFMLEIIYPLYIVFATVVSVFFSFDWKGREKLR